MSFGQKYEERVRKFSSLVRHHFKAELYRYIYIVIFGKHLPELYCIVLICIYNHFHNILRLFNVLPNFPFSTSEKMGDYYLER